MTFQNEYQKLLAISKKIRNLEGIAYLLDWDQETYMPSAAYLIRAEQIELVQSLIHKELTGGNFCKLLSKFVELESGKIKIHDFSLQQKACVREWRRKFLLASALPNSFVKDFAHTTSEAIVIWRKARQHNDFSLFAPYLEKIVELSRRKADYFGYKEHPYDALLDVFEPDTYSKHLALLFSQLKASILDLLKRILSGPSVDDSCLHGRFDANKQLEFGRTLLSHMGYDLEKGRLDISTHPFSTSIGPFDHRVTTRIHSSSIFDCISAVLHEGGHSLYEMGLVPEYYGSPIGEAISTGFHESQSRFWETFIGQSKPFWKYFFPLLIKVFPQLKETSLDSFYKAVNKVSPSFIRIESDEVTYSLHIILRFEIERRLIEGSLSVKDIPEVWGNYMKEMLNIVPSTDNEGCLQDIHWATGSFGYFPTYALGNLYAAQFFVAFKDSNPDWESRIESGDLLFIRNWLKENIHKYGCTYRANEMVKRVTGKELTVQPYISYLNEKYEIL